MAPNIDKACKAELKRFRKEQFDDSGELIGINMHSSRFDWTNCKQCELNDPKWIALEKIIHYISRNKLLVKNSDSFKAIGMADDITSVCMGDPKVAPSNFKPSLDYGGSAVVHSQLSQSCVDASDTDDSIEMDRDTQNDTVSHHEVQTLCQDISYACTDKLREELYRLLCDFKHKQICKKTNDNSFLGSEHYKGRSVEKRKRKRNDS